MKLSENEMRFLCRNIWINLQLTVDCLDIVYFKDEQDRNFHEKLLVDVIQNTTFFLARMLIIYSEQYSDIVKMMKEMRPELSYFPEYDVESSLQKIKENYEKIKLEYEK